MRLTRAPILAALVPLALLGCSPDGTQETSVDKATTTTADSSSTASQTAEEAPHDPPPGPPPEAFQACESKAAGDDCSVEIHGHTLQGKCRQGPRGESKLACAPPHMHPPGPPPGPPPEEVFQACESKTAGDDCSVEIHGHTLQGKCRQGPHGESKLACAPPPPPGEAPR